MDNLTLTVLVVFFAVILFFLGSIVYAMFFSTPDLSSDELLRQIQKSRGGEFHRVGPGRIMLEFSNPEGKVLIGYWQQRDVGFQVQQPSFHIRWQPSQAIDIPEFRLQQVTGARTIVQGLHQTSSPLRILDKSFDLFVKDDLSVQDQAHLSQRLAANLSGAMDTTVFVDFAHNEGSFSCRYREAIMTHDRAEELLDRTLDFLVKLS
jgi:hypothetical protein